MSAPDLPPSLPAPDARERILRAAEALIAQRGAQAATTKAVAEAAGLRQGLFHYYFASKEALLLELLRRQVADYVASSAARRGELAQGGLPVLFAQAAADLEQRTGPWRLRLELMHLGLANPQLGEAVRGLLAEARNQTAQNLAAARGAAAPGSQDLAMADALKAAMDGLAFQRLLDPDYPLGAAGDVLLAMTQALVARR
jgi:AcrR family transcriptional regulator